MQVISKSELETLEKAITPLAEASSFEIVDVEFLQHGSILRIFVELYFRR